VKKPTRAVALAAFLAAGAFAGSAAQHAAVAADHLDPPARTDPDVDSIPDNAADIADVYTWYTSNSVVICLTFAGPAAAGKAAVYDRDVLYTINISNAGLATDPEIQVKFRFGQDGANYGVQITGLPDGGGVLSGPVEETLTRSGIKARAGLYDDPFFFDLQGFRTTRSTGTLSFVSSRSFFTGQNDTSMVIEFPIDMVKGAGKLNIWATTARFGGQK
jgi:hypothetical protein